MKKLKGIFNQLLQAKDTTYCRENHHKHEQQAYDDVSFSFWIALLENLSVRTQCPHLENELPSPIGFTHFIQYILKIKNSYASAQYYVYHEPVGKIHILLWLQKD